MDEFTSNSTAEDSGGWEQQGWEAGDTNDTANDFFGPEMSDRIRETVDQSIREFLADEEEEGTDEEPLTEEEAQYAEAIRVANIDREYAFAKLLGEVPEMQDPNFARFIVQQAMDVAQELVRSGHAQSLDGIVETPELVTIIRAVLEENNPADDYQNAWASRMELERDMGWGKISDESLNDAIRDKDAHRDSAMESFWRS